MPRPETTPLATTSRGATSRSCAVGRFADGRWVQDTVREVFVACFRAGGALKGVDDDRRGGFRAFFLGVLRGVARAVADRSLGRDSVLRGGRARDRLE